MAPVYKWHQEIWKACIADHDERMKNDAYDPVPIADPDTVPMPVDELEVRVEGHQGGSSAASGSMQEA